jgi:hypothetical protein
MLEGIVVGMAHVLPAGCRRYGVCHNLSVMIRVCVKDYTKLTVNHLAVASSYAIWQKRILIASTIAQSFAQLFKSGPGQDPTR